jgi:hypothetical protein
MLRRPARSIVSSQSQTQPGFEIGRSAAIASGQNFPANGCEPPAILVVSLPKVGGNGDEPFSSPASCREIMSFRGRAMCCGVAFANPLALPFAGGVNKVTLIQHHD